MYGLVDCNNFYASCERVFRPDLNGRPVVVLSNNDGCVIARSNEAKALGIPMGAPAYQYEALFRANDVTVFSSNFVLYGDLSSRVMDILAMHCPSVEMYSIDEAFLDFSGCDYIDLKTEGTAILHQVRQWTGIPVSVGFAPTKTLAKLANHIAKKFPKETGGVHVINTDELRVKALKWQKIDDVWGIGRRYAAKLRAAGIKTAYDFSVKSDDWVRGMTTVTGLRIKMEMNGQSVIKMEEVQPKESIAVTRTFERDYRKYEEVSERVVTFASICAEKLRKQNSCAQALLVFIHTNPHRDNLPFYGKFYQVRFPFATNSSIEIARYALYGLKQIYKEGYAYKRAGVMMMNFVKADERQLTLFEESDPRHEPLMKAVDIANKKYGMQKIRLAAQDPERVWIMKQEKRTPHYTTDLHDIIEVKTD